LKKTILSLAAAGLLAAPALGASDMFRFTADASDLADAQSVAQLYERLDTAVMDYCVELVDEPQVQPCHDQVLVAVVAQFDSPALTALHERATGSAGSVTLAARDDGV
jgi:UrcA family protein